MEGSAKKVIIVRSSLVLHNCLEDDLEVKITNKLVTGWNGAHLCIKPKVIGSKPRYNQTDRIGDDQ